jgi:PD-(D/E)XK nuclease superfamily
MSNPQPTLPYVWTTWISKLLAGDNSCEWAAWYKVNRGKVATKNAGDFDAWRIKHAALLRRTRKELEDQECYVLTEDQNWFRLTGGSAVLGGKPDLISIGEACTICDVKAGQKRASDRIQVMIYMYAVPRAMSQYRGKQFDGLIVYEDDWEVIPADKIDATFITNLGSLIKRVSSKEPARRVPSIRECKFCDMTKDICEARIDGQEAHGETTDF